MEVYVTHANRQEIMEVLQAEGVAFELSSAQAVREPGTGSYPVEKINANLPEVEVPAMYRESSGDLRAFRLPRGKLILVDLEGNLERIVTPPPPGPGR